MEKPQKTCPNGKSLLWYNRCMKTKYNRTFYFFTYGAFIIIFMIDMLTSNDMDVILFPYQLILALVLVFLSRKEDFLMTTAVFIFSLSSLTFLLDECGIIHGFWVSVLQSIFLTTLIIILVLLIKKLVTRK